LIEEYLSANWDKAISIEELAQHTNIGARCLFATFRKQRGYTPMAFLQTMRLRHAREMLQSPAASASVLSASLKCGFLNAGHFARYYRQAFGELPSATLADARLIQGGAWAAPLPTRWA